MTWINRRTAGVLAMIILGGAMAAPAGAADDVKLSADAMAKWGEAQYVFTAKLERVDKGPMGLSNPPIYNHRLNVVVDRTLRGYMVKDDTLKLSHSARQQNEPTFPVGEMCVIAADTTRGNLRVLAIVKADAKIVTEAKLACSVPLGWKVEGGKLVSPWAGLQEKAWAVDAGAAALKCSVTGRPAALAGAGVKFYVEPVPPAKKIKWTNPDGDGEYKIVISNDSDKTIAVPALLAAGDNILWAESIVIICQKKAYTVPGAKGVPAGAKPVKLKPGQKISTTVNVLKLVGPKWPRGGYRIEFQFCLGEKSNVQSLYYMSRHHDKLREKAQEQ